MTDNLHQLVENIRNEALTHAIAHVVIDLSEIDNHGFDEEEWYRRTKSAQEKIATMHPEMSERRAHAIAAMIVSDGLYAKWHNDDEAATRIEYASYIVVHEEPASPSVVYFIQGVSGGPIKIGITTDLEARLKALTYHEPLSVLVTMPGVRSDELALHRRFAHCRVYGEWFEPTAELMEFIENARSDRS